MGCGRHWDLGGDFGGGDFALGDRMKMGGGGGGLGPSSDVVGTAARPNADLGICGLPSLTTTILPASDDGDSGGHVGLARGETMGPPGDDGCGDVTALLLLLLPPGDVTVASLVDACGCGRGGGGCGVR